VAKRVSLKGKGADIFFGDYAPPGVPTPEAPATDASFVDVLSAATPDATPDNDRSLPDTAGSAVSTTAESSAQDVTQTAPPSPPAIIDASKQASQIGSVLTSKQARTRASTQSGLQESTQGEKTTAGAGGGAEIDADVWTRVDMPATITNSFRYTEAELSTLTDVLYEIGKQHGAKLTKQDVARLGLNVILDEYRRRGSDSLLGKLAARRRQRRGGGS